MRLMNLHVLAITLCSIIHPCQSSFIKAFYDYFTVEEVPEEFDDVVPKMIRDSILSGEIKKYLKQENINKIFEEGGRRKLMRQNETVEFKLRPCDEEIYTFTSDEVREIMKDYLGMAIGSEGIPFQRTVEKWIERRWKYGLKAYKICASCADFRETYSGEGEGSNAFDEYCAEDIYGADETHSGLLHIPVDDDGEFLEISSKLAIWNRWVEFHATECPSEQFHNGTDWGSNFEEFDRWGYTPSGFLTAPLGVVSLLPDYLGFCESYKMDGAPANKKGYQTGIVPLVLKARDFFVEEQSEGKTTLNNEVVSSGFSEGGMTALVVGWALDTLGFDVRTQAGGSAIDHKSKDGLFNYYGKSIL